jgi:competence protein ComEA
MKQRLRVAIIVGSVAAMAAGTVTLAQSQQLPEGPGKAKVLTTCGVCHAPDRAASVRLTAEGWQWVIDEMRKRGAPGTDADFKIILDYLTTNFLGEGARPLNINTGARVDLEAVAGLTRRESAAVVAWREEHGLCKALSDLKQVPGLDYSKIESRKEYLVCFEPTPTLPAAGATPAQAPGAPKPIPPPVPSGP